MLSYFMDQIIATVQKDFFNQPKNERGISNFIMDRFPESSIIKVGGLWYEEPHIFSPYLFMMSFFFKIKIRAIEEFSFCGTPLLILISKRKNLAIYLFIFACLEISVYPFFDSILKKAYKISDLEKDVIIDARYFHACEHEIKMKWSNMIRKNVLSVF